MLRNQPPSLLLPVLRNPQPNPLLRSQPPLNLLLGHAALRSPPTRLLDRRFTGNFAARPPPEPNTPVAAVDLARYAGTWYEQAHLPMFFQRKCIADTTARYTVNADGTVAVVNRCRTRDGRFTEARGVARMVDGRSSTLEVRFAPQWLSWLPMVWGDSWVIALDEADYRWAMVGEPGLKYLWVL